jgi:hypothetical protein
MITIWEPLPVKENIYTQLSSVRGMIIIWEPLPIKENIYTLLSSVWQLCIYVLFYRKWFSYCYHFFYWRQLCVFSLTGSGSDIVIILLTEDSSVYMFSFIGCLWNRTYFSVFHIYAAVISEMNDNNITTTSCKREHIYTAVISEKNDNNIRTTSCEREHTQLSSVRGIESINKPDSIVMSNSPKHVWFGPTNVSDFTKKQHYPSILHCMHVYNSVCVSVLLLY